MSARGFAKAVAFAAVLAATGCRHRQPAAPLPVPPATQVPLAPTPEPASPPQVAQVPLAPTPLAAKRVPKPRKPRKKPESAPPAPQSTAIPAANQVAAATPPPVVIGSLSAGGESASAEKQKAADLIATVEKRMQELPAATRDSQREGLARVRDFLLKARDALHTGDADGASTLATKARLLLDDLLK